MALGVIDLLQVGIVGNRLDALLKRQHLVVARHHRDRSELQPLRKVHRADGQVAARRVNLVGQFDRGSAGCGYGRPRALQLRV